MSDKRLLKALDKLGLALANHNHTWTAEERDAYEHAVDLVKMHGTHLP